MDKGDNLRRLDGCSSIADLMWIYLRNLLCNAMQAIAVSTYSEVLPQRDSKLSEDQMTVFMYNDGGLDGIDCRCRRKRHRE